MWKYIRLLRLPDQYLQIGAILIAVLITGVSDNFWPWLIASTLISCTAFIVNEIVDSQDVDKYSWNKIHVKDKLDKKIVWTMFWVLSVLGLGIAYLVGLGMWGFWMWVVGVAYSLKPIRLKNVFALDILAQEVVWWIIPFAAIAGSVWSTEKIFWVLAAGFFLFWAAIFPYVLADFIADQKGKLKGTHIILGMKNSLYLGLGVGLIGIALYFGAGVYAMASWSLPFVGLIMLVSVLYVWWLSMRTISQQTKTMQVYSRFGKLATQIMTGVLFLQFLYT